MILQILISNKRPFRILMFHVFLGLVALLSPLVLVGYFYLVLISSIPAFNSQKTLNNPILFLWVYLLSFEVFARMLGTSPWIPYELSKYAMLGFTVMFIIKGQYRNGVSTLLLILLIPAFFFDLPSEVTLSRIVFNVLGAVNLSLAIGVFSFQGINQKGLETMVRLLLLPLISVLVYIFIKTPSFSELEFVLGAVEDTTGGFGSNQVSTIFGLGFFLTFVMFVLQWPLSGYRWLDLLVLALFVFQGLLSFSRGGMIGGVLAITIFVFFLRRKSNNPEQLLIIKRLGRLFFIGFIITGLGLYMANQITNGLLLQRYQGKTYGTIVRDEAVSLDVWTTGRVSILMDDVEVFLNHPFGVGTAASSFIRSETRGVLTHVELGRLLSEHGVFGALFFMLLIWMIWRRLRAGAIDYSHGIFIAFMVLALFTTFHAAMRTYVPPLLFGLGMIQYRPQILMRTAN